MLHRACLGVLQCSQEGEEKGGLAVDKYQWELMFWYSRVLYR